MKLPSERRAAAAISSLRDPRESEKWFQSIPRERREQMTQEFRAKQMHGLELQILDRNRAWTESACMGGAFLLAGIVCPGGSFLTGLLSLILGTGLGYGCNRFDAHRMFTSILGMFVFLGAHYVLLGGLSMFHVIVSFPMGVFFALLGFLREERGTM